MRYVAGIDGGGTKTRCLIGDFAGNILGDYTLGASNHQMVGEVQTKAIITEVYDKALDMAGVKPEDLEYIYLGMAGADLPSDFELLNEMCDSIFRGIPYKVVNDAWISMRSGSKVSWGAVSICGTGANAGACDMNGKRVILNALSYELGNYGGGSQITEQALHYAFRAYEGTGSETLLVHELPKLLGAADMGDLLLKFYPQRSISGKELDRVSPLVFSLANKRDRVCQQILIDMGHVLGKMVAGVIKKLNMENMEVPVVLGGSIYRGDNPLLIDELTTALHMDVPNAYINIPLLPPAAGAYLSALDSIRVLPDSTVYDTMERYFKDNIGQK